MATQFEIDCAIMAGRAYETNRNQNNCFPVPDGWTEFFHVPNDTYPTSSGFEAVSFTNGSEIVISFAGTDSKSAGDLAADIGLATGWGSAQLLQAAAYYMEVKAANPNAEITFTGHSLGGGLAALMGVFFDKTAVTFDQAPFKLSATEAMSYDIQHYLLNLKDQFGQPLYTVQTLQTLAPELLSFTDSALVNRVTAVSGYFVQGEALTTSEPYKSFLGLGNQVSLTHGPTDVKPWDLHSQSLLTALVADDDFRQVTNKLTDLLGMLFDSKLYANPTNEDKENFLERLIRHEFGNAPGVDQADEMLTRFTADLQKIAQDGGLSLTNNDVAKALTAFAMQMYYANSAASGTDKELFDTLTGGIHFNLSDVADKLGDAKGYNLYFKNYLHTLPGNETGVVTRQLSELLDWYIQAGISAMTSAAGSQSAFMLGGSGGDNLTGGTTADLLYGGTGSDMLTGSNGADTMIGGAGNDILNGGLGHDIYNYTIGDGNDQIIDADKDGEIDLYSNGTEMKRMALGNFYESSPNEWKLLDGSNIRISGNILYLSDGSTIQFRENLQSGDFGINLINTPDNPTATNTILGDLTPIDFDPNEEGIQTQNDQWGNVITDPNSPETGRTDGLYDTTGNDQILAGDGNDGIVSSRGGNDWLSGGSGDDNVIVDHYQTNSGADILEGNAGSDIVEGGKGSDKVFGGDYGEMEQLIAAGETAVGINARGDVVSGGEGDDNVYGLNSIDALFGGLGKDLLAGGGGDDVLIGDDNYVGAVRDWSYSITTTPSGNTNIYGLSFSGVYGGLDATGAIGDDDVIYGGAGSDTYVFHKSELGSNGEYLDKIIDDGVGDKIIIDGKEVNNSVVSWRNLAGGNAYKKSGETTWSKICDFGEGILNKVINLCIMQHKIIFKLFFPTTPLPWNCKIFTLAISASIF